MKHIRNRYFLVGDLILLSVAAYLSFVLRLEAFHFTRYFYGFLIFTGAVVLITPLIFRAIGIYSRYWRYASVDELLLLSAAVALATALAYIASLLVSTFVFKRLMVPRSIPLIFLLLALVVTAGPRLAVRLSRLRKGPARSSGHVCPVLVMGAGDAGAMIVRALRQNHQLGLEVVGFLDDDQNKRNVFIHGVPVLGDQQDIPRIVQHYHVQQVIIAMPTAPGKVIRQIVTLCELVGVQTKIIPGIHELLGGRVNLSQLRDVQIEDLLRREPIHTDTAAVGELIRGKRVLITGGGGSIGSELCRQVLRCEPAELVILGHGENSVFDIHNQVLRLLPQSKTRAGYQNGSHGANGNGAKPATRVQAVIADIRFGDRIRAVFEEFRPEIVFHAAAHKHVPLMELNPAEAVTNNILGTRNLLAAAQAVGVERFVMISTDKAVNPTSIMGASKRAAELLVHQAARSSGKAYVAVRFGNVLGSRGSVVHTFKQQIAAGGPVTITHPEMRRYFMTIPEAVQLVLQAAVLGQGGEVFMLDMGELVRIEDLARDMIELSGLEVGQDIEIVYTGLRPGEKLFEELFVPGESYQPTRHEKILIASNATNFIPARLAQTISELERAAAKNDRLAIYSLLQHLIPEYQPFQEQARTAGGEVGSASFFPKPEDWGLVPPYEGEAKPLRQASSEAF